MITNQGCIGSAPAQGSPGRGKPRGPVHCRYGLLYLSRGGLEWQLLSGVLIRMRRKCFGAPSPPDRIAARLGYPASGLVRRPLSPDRPCERENHCEQSREGSSACGFEPRNSSPGTRVARPRARRGWSTGINGRRTHVHEESTCSVGDRIDRSVRICSAESHPTIRSRPVWQTGQRCSTEEFGSRDKIAADPAAPAEAFKNCRHRTRAEDRLRLARKPKWRIFTNPAGRM